MKDDNDIDDFGLNWRSIEKPFVSHSLIDSKKIRYMTYNNPNCTVGHTETV